MDCKEINGTRQLDFVRKFDYIREAGTENEMRAAQTILGELKSFGVDGHLEPFEFETFEIQEARFIVTEPYYKEYTVTGYGRCGNTPEDGMEAPFLYVENGDDISLAYAKGKIVMINGDMKKFPYEKLVKAQAAGFVTIVGGPLDEGLDLIPSMRQLRGAKDSALPCATIHYQDAVELINSSASRAKLIVRQSTVRRTSQNIVARIEGTDKADEILTLTAHYDSVPAGPGAYDNMAACAIIMELCRYFKAHQPRRTIECIWFGAEEKGLCGSRSYVTAHEEELSRHQFNMNVDLAGQLVGGTVAGVTGDPVICQTILYMAHEIGLGISTLNQVWSSDSNCFAWKGVPAMTLNRDGFGMHTRHDTAALISDWSLKRSATLLGYIAERLSQLEAMPFPREIPAEFAEQLNRQFS